MRLRIIALVCLMACAAFARGADRKRIYADRQQSMRYGRHDWRGERRLLRCRVLSQAH